jgi:hypothetical protein
VTRFKELCLDVHGDVALMGEFWSAATGVPFDGGDLVSDVEGQGIALCPVPEPKTVKHRVHLDLHTDSVDTLLALGATRAPGFDNPDDAWTVLLDPEGGELCAFVRDEVPSYKVSELSVDAVDARAITAWWGEVFGVEPRNEGQPFWWLPDVPDMPFSILFCPVPEPKTVKNRVHWDVYGDVDDLLAHGATQLWEMPRWTVLADPEGNEFCVFPEP